MFIMRLVAVAIACVFVILSSLAYVENCKLDAIFLLLTAMLFKQVFLDDLD